MEVFEREAHRATLHAEHIPGHDTKGTTGAHCGISCPGIGTIAWRLPTAGHRHASFTLPTSFQGEDFKRDQKVSDVAAYWERIPQSERR
jgi:hypothetical protein